VLCINSKSIINIINNTSLTVSSTAEGNKVKSGEKICVTYLAFQIFNKKYVKKIALRLNIRWQTSYWQLCQTISYSLQKIHHSYHHRVLQSHGLCDTGLQAVFRSVVVTKILYASPAWSGFITATDWQRVDAYFRRSKRCGFCPPDLPSFEEMLEDAKAKKLKPRYLV